MTNDNTDTNADSDGVEYHKVTDTDGNVWAVLTYIPPKTPTRRGEGWIVDFPNGDRVTGDCANEIARRLMPVDGPARTPFNEQANTLLDTVVYDDDSNTARITVRGVRVWFNDAGDSGNDVVLYESASHDSRVGVIEDAPFDAADLNTEADAARRRACLE